MEVLESYWDTIYICDETLINMGYGPFFNDKNPRTEHEFTMLFKDGIAEEVNIVNGVPETKTDKDSIILEYPRKIDLSEKDIKGCVVWLIIIILLCFMEIQSTAIC